MKNSQITSFASKTISVFLILLLQCLLDLCCSECLAWMLMPETSGIVFWRHLEVIWRRSDVQQFGVWNDFFFCLWNGEEEEDEEWEGMWRYPVQGWSETWALCACARVKAIPPATHGIMAPCSRSNCSVIVQGSSCFCRAQLRCISPGEGATAALRLHWGRRQQDFWSKLLNSFYSDALDPHPGMFKMWRKWLLTASSKRFFHTYCFSRSILIWFSRDFYQ